MHATSPVWTVVLAAGDGSRLRALTTTSTGTAVPKQFCSLFDGPTLLHEALRRARTLAGERTTCVVVAAHHRQWWQEALAGLPERNVIVQPRNRGTAIGILLPLLCILEQDPDAQVVLLPSDHLVREEPVLAAALRSALGNLHRRTCEPLLMGMVPEEPDPQLGYIVPEVRAPGAALRVAQFVEKPTRAQAEALIRAGALWNAFIMVTRGQALLALLRARCADIVSAVQAALERDRRQPDAGALAALYEQLPALDFSRDIVAGQEAALRVVAVPPCGWSDLGTPQRVQAALQRGPQTRPQVPTRGRGPWLSLAAQHARLCLQQQALQA